MATAATRLTCAPFAVTATVYALPDKGETGGLGSGSRWRRPGIGRPRDIPAIADMDARVRQSHDERRGPCNAGTRDGQDLLECAIESGWRFDGTRIEDNAAFACFDNLPPENLHAQVTDGEGCYVRNWAVSFPFQDTDLVPRRHGVLHIRPRLAA